MQSKLKKKIIPVPLEWALYASYLNQCRWMSKVMLHSRHVVITDMSEDDNTLHPELLRMEMYLFLWHHYQHLNEPAVVRWCSSRVVQKAHKTIPLLSYKLYLYEDVNTSYKLK